MDGSVVRHRGATGAVMLAGMHADLERAGSEDEVGGAAAPGPPPLEAFLDGIAARAFRFAEAGLRSRDDAQDAVQDAMIRMLGYRDRPVPEWTPLFWTVLRSRMIDARRRRAFRLTWLMESDAREEIGVEWADAGPGPSRLNDGREAYSVFVGALRDLPQRQREAFSLRVLEELDVATTARVMGCSEGSVKTHLSRARDALQQRLEDFR